MCMTEDCAVLSQHAWRSDKSVHTYCLSDKDHRRSRAAKIACDPASAIELGVHLLSLVLHCRTRLRSSASSAIDDACVSRVEGWCERHSASLTMQRDRLPEDCLTPAIFDDIFSLLPNLRVVTVCWVVAPTPQVMTIALSLRPI